MKLKFQQSFSPMATPSSSIVLFSVAIGLLIIIFVTMNFFRKNHFNVNGKTILLTGASEGMGKSVAELLAAKGANIVIVSRNTVKLEAAMVDIKAAATSPTSQRFHYIAADMSSATEVTRVLDECKTFNHGHSLDVVWCMAGYARPSLFLDCHISDMRSMMEVNFWSCAEMAQLVLKEWLAPASTTCEFANRENKKGEGEPKEVKHLIFTSSTLAFYTIVGYAPYSPSKWAVRALSDTLAQEVLLYESTSINEVKIHTVFPGSIDTAGLAHENKSKPEITFLLEKDDPVQSAAEVASRSIRGLERGDYLITVALFGDAMKGCMQGGVSRNSWWYDTLLTWITALAWLFVGPDLDRKVRKFGRQRGHPSTYVDGKRQGA